MKLFGLFGKPDWQSKNAETRAKAVAASQDQALVDSIPDIACHDQNPAVRKQAIKRLTNLAMLADRSRNDEDADNRRLAKDRFVDLLLEDLPGVVTSLHDRERLIRVEDDQSVLMEVAKKSKYPELRRLSLERISKPGFIVERCLLDASPDIRMWLLGRIDTVGVLEKIAEQARKKDKQLARAARDSIEKIRLASGDAQTYRQRALDLCQKIDVLRKTRPLDFDRQFEDLKAVWDGLRAHIDQPTIIRVDGFFKVFDELPVPESLAPPVLNEVVVSDAPVQAEAVVSSVDEEKIQAELLSILDELKALAAQPTVGTFAALQRRFEQSSSSLVSPPADVREAYQVAVAQIRNRMVELERERASLRESFNSAVAGLEAALQEGRLAEAKGMFDQVQAIRQRDPGVIHGKIGLRLQDAETELTKLGRWQRWSNNKVRNRLCDEVEALVGSGLHPDALANKIKTAREEWAKLEAMESKAGVSPESGLQKRFRALCHRALSPAKAYFDKRKALREQGRQGLESALAGIEGALERGELAGAALHACRKELAELLRRLDEVETHHRGELARRLRAAMARVDDSRNNEHEQAELDKRKLLANLKRQMPQAELPDALAMAKQAQSRFQKLPKAKREVEEALRAELRALVEPWFEKDRLEKDAAVAARGEMDASMQAVIDETRALLSSPDALLHAEGKLAQCAQQWRELTQRHAASEGEAAGKSRRSRMGLPREAEFERLAAQVEQAIASARRVDGANRRKNILVASDLCNAFDRSTQNDPAESDLTELRSRLQALALAPSSRSALERRLASHQTARSVDHLNTDAARLLAVRLELLAGIASPAEDGDLRREYQMQRLARRMGGEVGLSADVEASAILDEWLATGAQSSAEHETYRARLASALAALHEMP